MFGIIKVNRGSLKYSTELVRIGAGICSVLPVLTALVLVAERLKKKYIFCVYSEGRGNGGNVMARDEALRAGSSVLTLTCC